MSTSLVRRVLESLHVDCISDAVFEGLLSMITFVLYDGSFSAVFAYDDRAAIITNPDVTESSANVSIAAVLRNVFSHDFWGQDIQLSTSHKSYRPLTVLVFRLTHFIYGLEPHGYHLINVAVFMVTVIAVYRLYQRWTSKAIARIAAMIFLFHPIHVESVTAVVGLADCLCGLLMTCAIIAYSSSSSSSSSTRCESDSAATTTPTTTISWLRFVLAHTLAIAACLSKEIGATVFGVFIAMDVFEATWFTPDDTRDKQTIVTKIRAMSGKLWSSNTMKRLLSSVAVLFIFLVIRLKINGEDKLLLWTPTDNHIASLPGFIERSLSYGQCHFWYLFKLVLPRYLSFDYGYACIPTIHSIFDVRNALPVAAYSVVITVLMRGLIASRRSLIYATVLFVLPLIPALNILFPVGTVLAERLLFVPSMGFCLTLAELWVDLLTSVDWRPSTSISTRHNKKSVPTSLPEASSATRQLAARRAWIIALPLFALMGVRLSTRILDWRSEERVYQSALSVCPTSIKALTNYAALHMNTDGGSLALVAAKRASAFYTSLTAATSTVGVLLMQQQDWVRSMWYLEHGLGLNEHDTQSRNLLCQALQELAVKLSDKDATDAMQRRISRLAQDSYRQGRLSALLLHVHGSVALDRGDLNSSVKLLQLAIAEAQKQSPFLEAGIRTAHQIDGALVLNQLGNTYMQLNSLDEASATFSQAIQLNNKLLAPYANLGNVLMRQQRHNEAIDAMKLGWERVPESENRAPLLNNLGLAFSYVGRKAEAEQAYKEGLRLCVNHYELKEADPTCQLIATNLRTVI